METSAVKDIHGSLPTRHLVVRKAVPSPPASGLAGSLLATLYAKFNPIKYDACVD